MLGLTSVSPPLRWSRAALVQRRCLLCFARCFRQLRLRPSKSSAAAAGAAVRTQQSCYMRGGATPTCKQPQGLTDGVELGALLAEALGLAVEDDGMPAGAPRSAALIGAAAER